MSSEQCYKNIEFAFEQEHLLRAMERFVEEFETEQTLEKQEQDIIYYSEYMEPDMENTPQPQHEVTNVAVESFYYHRSRHNSKKCEKESRTNSKKRGKESRAKCRGCVTMRVTGVRK